MRSFINLGKTLSVVAFIAIVAGCGSSDDDGGGASGGDATLSGVFIDTAVEGLNYDCQPSGFTGLTDANGTYSYKAGDQCTFSIPSTPNYIGLGTTTGNGIVTPLNFLNAEGNEDKLVNMLLLLQSLDADANLDNGIQLPDNIRGYVDEGIVIGVEDWLSALDEFLWLGNGIQRDIEPEEALEHFYTGTDAFFQTPLTEAMFSDKQIAFDNGVISLSDDMNYEMSIYDQSEPCWGTWSVSGTKATLDQATCGFGYFDQTAQTDKIEIDFDRSPAVDSLLRAKIGTGPYEYGFEKVSIFTDSTTPVAPTNLGSGYNATVDSVSIRWDDNSNNETYFQVLYNYTGDFSAQNNVRNVMGSNAATGNMTLTGLAEGTTVYFKVRAWGYLISSDTSNEFNISTLSRPAAPTDLAHDLYNLQDTIGVHWTDNADNEEHYVLELYYDEAMTNPYGAPITLDADSTGYRFNTAAIIGVDTAEDKWMRVKATNSAGSSSYSAKMQI